MVVEQRGENVTARLETWSRPPRLADRWTEFVTRWRAFVPDGGGELGALEDGRLVGIGPLPRDIHPGVDQLGALFVDRAHRRRGMAAALIAAIASLARDGGVHTLDVSATPSEPAVGCHRSRGFPPTPDLIPKLLGLEPEDIHMVLEL